MNFIAFADIHLSETNLSETLPPLNFILEETQKRTPDFVFFLGDAVVRMGILYPEQSIVLRTFFLSLAKVCPVYLLRGNHDIVLGSNGSNSLYGIVGIEKNGERTSFENINIIDRPCIKKFDGFQGIFLPYPDKQQYKSKEGNVSNEELSQKLKNVLNGYNIQLNKDTPSITFFHGTVLGGTSDVDKSMMSDYDVTINPGDLVTDFTFAGHLHKFFWVY